MFPGLQQPWAAIRERFQRLLALASTTLRTFTALEHKKRVSGFEFQVSSSKNFDAVLQGDPGGRHGLSKRLEERSGLEVRDEASASDDARPK